ncbi:hypothetical protein ACFFHM_03240 [Halalkalibacter kiskunsagensis]|uniref:Uncharacterized protein n=1 Tax=Halalkalibacter kiskunsagensis TaxID=1548599 RepID=A0ABV6K943_9BACI
MEPLKGLKKKEFAIKWGLDHTLPKDKWRTEVKKADQYCKWHTEGVGAGTKYYIDEIYEVIQERVHGNTGIEPVNKGVIDKNSLKYKLAFTLISLSAQSDTMDANHHAKRAYAVMLGCDFENLKHAGNIFKDKELCEMDAVDRFTMKLVNNHGKSLNGRLDQAFDLIEKGIFEGVTLDKRMYVATFKNGHHEANELEELYPLYQDARTTAEKIVNERYGTYLYYVMKMNLINEVYLNLIEDTDIYKPLYDNEISYFYNKYAVIGSMNKTEVVHDYEALDYDGSDLDIDYDSIELADEFKCDFIEHREELAVRAVRKFVDSGTIGITCENRLNEFAVDFTELLFNDYNAHVFNERYKQLMIDVRQIENTGFGIAV